MRQRPFQIRAMLLGATALTALAGTVRAQSPAPADATTTADPTTSSVPAATPSSQAAAASVAEERADPEEIVVTGIRGSIRDQLDIRRAAEGVVDAITALDVGKFPDRNIADALQRITGVTIGRDGGEGRTISVRGFSDQYNTVTLNNRLLATDSSGRGFNFDVLSSDFISTAQVYKTFNASLSEGSIGGLVDITTARPLTGTKDTGFKIAGQAAGTYDTHTEEVSPRASVTGSWVNEARTFGATLSLVYDERTNRNDSFNTGAGYFDGWGGGVWTGPALGQGQFIRARYPETINIIADQGERTRYGAFGTVQWQPLEQLTVTVDGLYAKFEADLVSDQRWAYQPGAGYLPGLGNYYNVEVDENGTLIRGTISPGNFDPRRGINTNFVEPVADRRPRDTTTYQIGGNLAWDFGDGGVMRVDGSYSRAKDESGGRRSFVSVGIPLTGPITLDNTRPGAPIIASGFPTGNEPGTRLFANQAAVVDATSETVEDDLYTYRVDYKRDFEEALGGSLKQVFLGIDGTFREKGFTTQKTPDGIGEYYRDFWLQLPNDVLVFKDFPNFFSGTPVQGYNLPFASTDPSKVFAFLESPAAYNQENPNFTPEQNAVRRAAFVSALQAAGGRYGGVPDPTRTRGIEENVFSAFVQTTLGGEILSRPWSATVGLRYSRTELRASGNGTELLDLIPITLNSRPGETNGFFLPDGSPNPDYRGGFGATFSPVIPIVGKNDYDDFLPSASFNVDIRDDVKFRFVYAKTITRPNISDLTVQSSYTYNDKPTVRSGAFDLKPYEADNFDAALEWYFTRNDAITFTGFLKNVKNFPVVLQDRVSQTFPGTGGNPVTFDRFRLVNQNEAKLYGFEAALSYSFDELLPAPFDGLGFQANYTKIEQDKDATAQILGLADSANLIGYYEKGPVQVRFAYTWRDESLGCFGCGAGFSSDRTNGDYDQLDFSASYRFFGDIEAFVEGVNITDNYEYSYEVYKNRVNYLYAPGSRYSFGVRGRF